MYAHLKSASKNSDFSSVQGSAAPENRSIHSVYEDSSTALMQQSRKKRIFRGTL